MRTFNGVRSTQYRIIGGTWGSRSGRKARNRRGSLGWSVTSARIYYIVSCLVPPRLEVPSLVLQVADLHRHSDSLQLEQTRHDTTRHDMTRQTRHDTTRQTRHDTTRQTRHDTTRHDTTRQTRQTRAITSNFPTNNANDTHIQTPQYRGSIQRIEPRY
jgi:hypothetical protein